LDFGVWVGRNDDDVDIAMLLLGNSLGMKGVLSVILLLLLLHYHES
jgi:hypothetical protein